MWPLSCCWYTEWTHLSDTSKCCNYSENGSHKEETVSFVPNPVNRTVCFTCIEMAHNWKRYSFASVFVERTKSQISGSDKVNASAMSVGGVWDVRPWLVPCQWSESKRPIHQIKQGCPVWELCWIAKRFCILEWLVSYVWLNIEDIPDLSMASLINQIPKAQRLFYFSNS